jgi:hypothetical protein
MSKKLKVSQQTINSVVGDLVDDLVFDDKEFRARVKAAALEAMEKHLASPAFLKKVNQAAEDTIEYVLEDGIGNIMDGKQYKEFTARIIKAVLK